MFNLAFTIGSLFFIILLTVSYYGKKRFDFLRNKVYRYLLIEEITLLITEIVAGLYLEYANNYTIALFLHRIHWITGILYGILLFTYGIIFISNSKLSTIKELFKDNKYFQVLSIVFLILFIIYFFVPFEQLNPKNVSYVPGYAAYYVLLFNFFAVIMLSIYLLYNKELVDFKARISIWIMIFVIGLLFTFQFIYRNVAFSGLASSIMIFFLYFVIENPDLRLINTIKSVKTEIEEANNAKTDFLLNMSHEIRSPMNAIIGFTESILNSDDYNSDSVKSDMESIYNAGNNLLDIVNNILDISKIETSNEELNLKEYYISNIITELSSIIETRIGDNPVKLIIDVDPNIPRKLYGDHVKIYQILLNILMNAVKYTEVGKIKLSLTGDIKDNNIVLHFKIKDTGYGIKKDDFDKLFSKFSRLDNAVSNEIEGTGLGLVITKKYVDLMNGKIWFDSEYNVGTTFYIDISQKIIENEALGDINEVKKEKKDINYIDCSKYTILIVDDNKLNLKVATRLFEKYKFNIETCESGKDCIYQVKSGKKYDMIFLDHMMPEMDGIQTLHKIKKLEDYDIPPIIALTANAITGMREMYLKEGFDEYLSKPINITDLDKLINHFLNKGEDKNG